MFVLTPAYGRDYKSKREVEAAFLQGKDFVANSPTSSGYIGLAEIQKLGLKEVQIRYKRLTQVTMLKVPCGKE